MQNFFKLFELEEQYNLTTSILNSKYFALLAKYHPDKASSEKEKYEYLTYSSLINNGYKILNDDFERAAHILEIHGINIRNDSLAPKLPKKILEEILEQHEKLDLATTDEERMILRDMQASQKQKLLSEMQALFDAKNYNDAAITTMQLRYL